MLEAVAMGNVSVFLRGCKETMHSEAAELELLHLLRLGVGKLK
jgi:hypothetical protein